MSVSARMWMFALASAGLVAGCGDDDHRMGDAGTDAGSGAPTAGSSEDPDGGQSGVGGAGEGGTSGTAGTSAGGGMGGAGSGANDAGMADDAGLGSDGGAVDAAIGDAGVPDSGPVDPCQDVADACDAEGASCDGASLVTCAEDEDGCLVETRVDCVGLEGNNACVVDDDTAACGFEPCRDASGQPKEDVCVVPDTTCADGVLVECVEDDDGCFIAERTNCTTAEGSNFCNAALDPPACDLDPCIGVTDCVEPGASCRGVDIVTCAENPDGCLVEEVTRCTDVEAGFTCAVVDETPSCVACTDDPACEGQAEGDAFCDGNIREVCSDTDGDGCLDVLVEDCGTTFTCDAAAGCVFDDPDACDGDVVETLREPGSFGPYATAGGDNAYASYTCPGLILPFQSQAPEQLFALHVPPETVTTVRLVDPEGFENTSGLEQPGAWLMVLTSCGDDAQEGTSESTCESLSSSDVSHVNEGTTTDRVYVVVDAEGSDNDGTFGLEVDTRPYACGDGHIDGGEECDDGNIFADDGCAPDCTLEEGFSCTNNDPSVCTRRPEDGVCGNVQCSDLAEGAPSGATTCCTAEQTCGVAYAFYYGAGCFERDQPGVSDEACPDESSGFEILFPALEGCCREDDRCGLRSTSGAGCMERTEVWLNMQDGFGSIFFGGPFEEIACDYTE